jgi:steroid 5-alpha reductase family enzyme
MLQIAKNIATLSPAMLYFNSGAIIFFLVLILWLLSLVFKNASIIDIFWGAGFVIIVWYANIQQGVAFPSISASGGANSVYHGWLLTFLVSIWGLRLSFHIHQRNHGKPEDYRYAAWRKKYRERWWWLSFFKVFLVQGVLLWVIAAPVIAGQYPRFSSYSHVLDALGVIVWLIGFTFEALGDWQLAQFKKDTANASKVMTTGVWQYTRHPNYFGDAAQWWGFYMIAAAAGAWWTIFSPILMTFLLMLVSGVPLLEKIMRRRPGYPEYAARTNAFFPWLPKK